MKVVTADETSITLSGRFTYVIIESESNVSLWVERRDAHNPTFLLSADNTGEGWRAVFAKARDYEARGFNFQPPE